MHIDSLIVFIHILAGSTLVSMSAIMQLIVGPAVAVLSPGDQKKNIVEKLKKRRIPVMDGAIIIQILTALYLLKSRWNMITSEPVMQLKVFTGTVALTLAFVAHFYVRNKKNKLEQEGKKDELLALNKKGRMIEIAVLISGSITYLLGVYFNHM